MSTMGHGLFYGLHHFRCKTVQLCETPCERRTTKLPGVSNDMQSSDMPRNSLGLNYKSAALNQLSYAGALNTKARFNEFINIVVSD